MKKKLICNKCSATVYVDFPIMETNGVYSLTDFMHLCSCMLAEGLLPFVRINHVYGNKLEFSMHLRCETCGLQELTISHLVEPIAPVAPVVRATPITTVSPEETDHSTLVTTASVIEDPHSRERIL